MRYQKSSCRPRVAILLAATVALLNLGVCTTLAQSNTNKASGASTPSGAIAGRLGLPSAEVWVDKDHAIHWSDVVNPAQGLLQLTILLNGKHALSRHVQPKSQYRFFRRESGVYTAYLEQFVEGRYRIISNLVSYEIEADNGPKTPRQPMSAPRPVPQDPSPPKASSSDGPRAELWLDKDQVIRRSGVTNDSGGLLQWVVKFNGQVALKRNARNETSYRYFHRAPGSYTVCLEQFVDGRYRVISNEVAYTLSEEDARVAASQRASSLPNNLFRSGLIAGRELLDAISDGDMSRFRAALDSGADVNYQQDGRGLTPLIWALRKNLGGDKTRIEMARELLRRGANVNLRGNGGETALMVAFESAPDDLIQELMAAGADPLSMSEDGRSALFAACRRGHIELATKFIGMGAPVRVESYRKETPLLLLLDSGSLRFGAFREDEFIPLVQLLLDKGVDAGSRRRMDNKTAADLAYEYHLPRLLKLLDISKKYALQLQRLEQQRPLRQMKSAIAARRADVVERYLKEGFPVNPARPGEKTSLLTSAVHSGDLKTVQLLLRHGADPNYCGDDAETPLSAAVGNPEIAELLLARKADPRRKHPKTQETALHEAAKNGDCRGIELLIAKGADVNAEATRGVTPIHYAAMRPEDEAETLQVLLKYGANPNRGGGKSPTPLLCAASSGAVRQMQVLIEHGAKLDMTGANGETPLIAAAAAGKADAVKFLVDKGANPLLKDKTGKTAADYAAKSLFIPILRLVDKDGTHAKTLREFTPDPASPWLGVWAYRKQGFGSFGFVLKPDGSGILGTDVGQQSFLWKEAPDKVILILPNERQSAPPQSLSFSKASNPPRLLLQREGKEISLTKQPVNE
jgi:ankyrin repeat protein